MISIQQRLLLTLGIGALALTALAWKLLDASLASELLRRHDDTLLARTYSLANALQSEDGALVLENDYGLSDVKGGREPGLTYEVRGVATGKVHKRSGATESLPNLSTHGDVPVFDYWSLRDGNRGRVVGLRVHLPGEDALDETESKPSSTTAGEVGGTALVEEEFDLIAGDDLQELDSTMATFRRGYTLIGGVVLLLGSGLVLWSLQRGLAPLHSLGERVEELNATSLRSGLGTDPMPRELEPIRRCLSDLLLRVDDALERERRFQSAAAHELRTPIAELRTAIEVEILEPESAEHAISLRTMAAVVRRMQSLVEALLLLRRIEARAIELHSTPVHLRVVVEGILHDHASVALERSVIVSFAHGPEPTIQAHAELLRIALRNVIANAITYVPDRGTIHVAIASDSDAVELCVSNSAPLLQAADVDRLFEPFWRRDTSRSGSDHAGLGLSITRAAVESMGMSIRAELSPDGVLSMRIHMDRSAVSQRD